jgi:hypothetical protein
MTQAAALAAYGSNSPSNRNRIINGDMRIDQRNAGASSLAANSTYYLDRWVFYSSQNNKFNIGQNLGSVTPPAGFKNYLGMDVASSVSVAAGDYFNLAQQIEGFNIADLGWGTANAKTATLSFWVYSSLTGTFGGALRNNTVTRSYPFSYTIATANTWTQISVTIAGETTGTWVTNNGIGIQLWFGLGVGSTYSGTAGSWAAGNYVSATGATSVVGTSGATFYITGVQLEAGSVATPFEHRQYGTEEYLCKRYYQKYVGTSTYGFVGFNTGVGTGTSFNATIAFEQEMRTAPSFTATLTGFGCWDGASLRAITAVSTQYTTTKGSRIDMTVGGGGLTTGHSYSCYGSSSTVFQLNAEL